MTQYLSVYGLKIGNARKLERCKEDALQRKGLSEWLVLHYEKVKNLLSWLGGKSGGNLREHRDDESFWFEASFVQPTPEEEIFLLKFNFSYEANTVSRRLNRSEIRYLTGGWLEEFCFNVQQMGELVSASGVEVVGPLPGDLQNTTVYAAAIPVTAKEPDAAKALTMFL